MKRWRSDQVRSLIITRLAQKMKAQNEAFRAKKDGGLYPLNFPGRVKDSEFNTMCNAVRIWCADIERQINQAKGKRVVVSNVVWCNRASLRNNMGCARSANRHLAKGALIGVFAGRPYEPEEDPKEYFFYETSDGEKKGAVPEKDHKGRISDFGIILNPDLILKDAFPPNVEFDFISSFEEFTPLEGRKKTPQYIERIEPLKNKETKQGVPSGPLPPSSLQASMEEEGVPSEPLLPSLAEPDFENITTTKQEDFFAAAQAQFAAWVIAFAKMIMESYLKNIPPAMNQSVHPKEENRGFLAVCRILARMSEDQADAWTDRVLRLIAFMRDWIEKDPEENWVPMPSIWFDLNSFSNIKQAWDRYYLPDRERKAAMASKEGKAKLLIHSANQLKEQSPGHRLAVLQYKFLIHKYPGNKTLEKTNLDRWADDFQKMMKRDKASFEEIQGIIRWIYNSPKKQAEFWREDAGGYGIRAACGIRRNYQLLAEQFHKST